MNEHIVKLFRLCRGIVGFWAPALLQIILGKLVSVAIRDQPKSPFISERLRVHPWLLWITNRNGIIFRVGDKQGSFCKITALSLQTVCAVRFSRKGLKILVGLLTGHNTLNRHLSLLKIEEDPMCPLCGEEYDTSLRLLGICSALVGKWRKQFEKHFLFPRKLWQEHWSSLLNFAKNSQEVTVTRLSRGCALCPPEASALGGNTPSP